MNPAEDPGRSSPPEHAPDRVRRLAALAGAAVERFPSATLFVVLFALVANRIVALPGDPTSAHWRLLFALLTASAAATAVQLALEIRRAGPLLRLAVPALGGALFGVLAYRATVPLVEVPLLLGASMLAVPLAPFIGKGRDGAGYWTFFLWGAAGAALAFVAVMVSISGLTTVLELVRLFFGIGLSFEAYAHVYATAFGLVGPIFALASLPATGEAAPRFSAEDRLIRLARPLLEWIAPALLLLQGAVLHLSAPLALAGPDGRLEAGLLSVSFLIGVTILRVSLEPFRGDPAGPARLYLRIWRWLLPVPIALLLVVAVSSANREGIDETSYVLFATALAAGAIGLLQATRLKDDVVVMSLVPIAALLVAAAGPLSLADTVSRSQAALIENRYGAAIRSAEPLNEVELRDVRRAVTRVAEFRQTERLAPLVGEARIAELRAVHSRSTAIVADRILALIGLPEEGDPAGAQDPGPLRILESNAWSPIAVGSFDTVLPSVPFEVGEADRQAPTDPAMRVEGTVLTIRFGTQEDRVDLAPLIAGMPEAVFDAGSVDLPVTSLATEGGRRIGIRPGYLSVDAANRPQGGWLALLLNANEWTSLGGD